MSLFWYVFIENVLSILQDGKEDDRVSRIILLPPETRDRDISQNEQILASHWSRDSHVTWILDSDWSRLITWHVCWPLIGPQDVQSSCRTMSPRSTWISILKILLWCLTGSQHLLYFSPFIDIWKGMTGNKMAHRWRYKNRIKDSFHFIESVEVMESLSLCVFVQCSQ